jgi:hypothetical protein
MNVQEAQQNRGAELKKTLLENGQLSEKPTQVANQFP